MHSIKSILLLALLVLSNSLIAGGGWPQPKGKGFIKLSEWWIISNQHFSDSGLTDPNTTNGIFTTSLYLEYGITDKLTVTSYIPLFSRAYHNNEISQTTGEIITAGDAINSFGDTDIGLTYGLTKGKINTTASLIFGLPLGVDNGGERGTLQTGDGEFNQFLKVDAGLGYKIGGANAYANTYVGYNNRTRGFSDELRWGIESGVNLFGDKILFLVRLFGVVSAKNGDGSVGENSTSIFANNAEHLTLSPEINYNIRDNWGVSVTYASALAGKLIFASPSYSVGVFAKF